MSSPNLLWQKIIDDGFNANKSNYVLFSDQFFNEKYQEREDADVEEVHHDADHAVAGERR